MDHVFAVPHAILLVHGLYVHMVMKQFVFEICNFVNFYSKNTIVDRLFS